MDNLLERVDALEHDLRTLQAHTHAVERRLRWWRRLACGLVILALIGGALQAGPAADAQSQNLGDRLADLEDTLRKLKKLLAHITIAKDDEGRPEIILSGVNLRIVNGLGSTDCQRPEGPFPDCPNGLGNLIVGYNELRETFPDEEDTNNVRTGSHNVVVGQEHNFSSVGGIVVGAFNTIGNAFASVSGGRRNTAMGRDSSVSGGENNTASGDSSAISGGQFNTASGFVPTISGGENNMALGFAATVSGGRVNTALGESSAVSGGSGNTASGSGSSVSGGAANTASGNFASISGGVFNTASASRSSVSGGRNRTAEGEDDWVAGSLVEDE
jgi:trimeric autotransporter adhesin